MKKYCFHNQFDIINAIEIIPGDWMVSDSNDDNGIYSFLKSVISYCLNQRRIMSCARNVAEMDLLNVECELI